VVYVVILLHIHERQALADLFTPEDPVAEFPIEMDVPLAFVSGKELEPPGIAEAALDFIHELGADASVLIIRMYDKPSDQAGIVIHACPDRAHYSAVQQSL